MEEVGGGVFCEVIERDKFYFDFVFITHRVLYNGFPFYYVKKIYVVA